MDAELKTVLLIGASDPTGGAGIQADIRAVSSLGLHPLTVVTAITIQNSKGVFSVIPVSKELLFAQIRCILDEVMPDAIKIGVCGSLDNVNEISEFLQATPIGIPVVVDPVVTSSAGGSLVNSKDSEKDMWNTYIKKIFHYSTVITPNIIEARTILSHISPETENEYLSPESIADILIDKLSLYAIVLKGGHGVNKKTIEDLLVFREDGILNYKNFISKKIKCINLHGTGCAYASFLSSYLALGLSMEDAFLQSSQRMANIIQKSNNYQLGNSKYGPLNLSNYKK